MGRMNGKRVAVFGAGSVGPGWGNGKAAAVLYAREGAAVLCVDRNAAAAAETVSIIEGEAGRAAAFAGDMTEEAAVADAVAAAKRRLGGLDVVHFNIGVSVKGGVLEATPQDWDRVFDVNLRSAMLVARAALPGLRAQRSGAFVFISSVAAVKSAPYSYVSYEVSKAALCRLSATLAAENAKFGVRSNAILPGLIDTPHVMAFVAPDADPDEVARSRAALVPLGRQGTAWDVAHAALFLASDEASFVTGVALKVDGGGTL